jgi:hypothetical protein
VVGMITGWVVQIHSDIDQEEICSHNLDVKKFSGKMKCAKNSLKYIHDVLFGKTYFSEKKELFKGLGISSFKNRII